MLDECWYFGLTLDVSQAAMPCMWHMNEPCSMTHDSTQGNRWLRLAMEETVDSVLYSLNSRTSKFYLPGMGRPSISSAIMYFVLLLLFHLHRYKYQM